jgi:hypothetical protein
VNVTICIQVVFGISNRESLARVFKKYLDENVKEIAPATLNFTFDSGNTDLGFCMWLKGEVSGKAVVTFIANLLVAFQMAGGFPKLKEVRDSVTGEELQPLLWAYNLDR